MTEIRDFDAEVQALPAAGFRLGGEDFTIRRSVRPEVLIQWGNLDESNSTPEQSIQVIDDLMAALLVPGDHAKWSNIRRLEGDGEVGLGTLTEVVKYAIEAVSGRPTSAPSASGPGRSDNGTSSTDDSPPRGLISVASPSAAS